MNDQNPPQDDQTSAQDDVQQDINLDTIQEELEQTRQKLEEMTVISQRALADLQNFKRRTEEERSQFVTMANAALFKELLPVLESASRALEHQQKDEEWTKGVEQTLAHLLQTIEKMGLTPIATDGEFDPEKHEALLTGPGPDGQIVEVLEKGYMLGDKVIKPARVKVGNGQ
ncbi:MAG: nucleotide exchange factor GrpE [Candidatus Gracilibacteria bacterium]